MTRAAGAGAAGSRAAGTGTAGTTARANLGRAGIASGWVIAGRLVGLGWTLTLLTRVGVSDYGSYAMGFALAAIVAAPLDNVFYVRSLRVEQALYARERSARALCGGVVFVLGAALFVPTFLVGFALLVAGGEILFNALKSEHLRAGHPQRAVRLDLARQGASIAIGAGYLFLTPQPQLAVAAALYLTPYLVVAVAAIRCLGGTAPRLHSSPRETMLLVADALGLGLYLQGDILILGLVASSALAGVYSIASLIALAAVSVAQLFAQTYAERLRVAHGAPSAGPAPALWVGVCVVLGAGVAAIAGSVAVVRPGEAVIPVLLVMSVFAALRSGSTILTSFLYVQQRDGHRVLIGGLAAIAKLALILVVAGPLGPLGAVGTAAVAVAVELVIVTRFARLVYSWRAPVRGL